MLEPRGLLYPSRVPARLRARRRAACAALLLAVVTACGGESKPPTSAEWDGPPLATDRRTATEYAVTALTPADPEVPAGRILGAKTLAKQDRLKRGARVYEGANGVEVHIRPESPTVVFAKRPAAPGPLPDDEQALAATRAVMKAYGMDSEEWTPTVSRAGDAVSVRYDIRAELPVREAAGVPQPLASFAVDAAGVRVITLALVRFTARPAPIQSEQDAFGRLTRAERYRKVQLVLVNDGKGVIRPYWEFETDKGELRPVLAVLTP